MVALRLDSPFFLDLFGTTACMVLLGSGWGTVSGVALASTDGTIRGALIGLIAGLVLVLVWAAWAGPESAGWILRISAYGMGFGAALGWGMVRLWQFSRKS